MSQSLVSSSATKAQPPPITWSCRRGPAALTIIGSTLSASPAMLYAWATLLRAECRAVCDVAGPTSARAFVGIPGHRRGIESNGRRQDLAVPNRQGRSVRGGSRLGGGCNLGSCSRYRGRSGDGSSRPPVRHAHLARRPAPLPTPMTAAAVVVVLVCERVFEFEFVWGQRLAVSGSRCAESREPRPAGRTRSPHTDTNSNTRSHTTTRPDLHISFPPPAQILHRFQRLALRRSLCLQGGPRRSGALRAGRGAGFGSGDGRAVVRIGGAIEGA